MALNSRIPTLKNFLTNSHTYRVFNNHYHKVVQTVLVWFDESNGSQREQLRPVIDEPAPDEAIKTMGIGEIKPVEELPTSPNDEENPSPP